MYTITLLVLITSTFSYEIISTTGQIKFDANFDNQAELILNSTGLGIGVTPSTNLHVNGNAIVSDQLFVGGSSGVSNLNMNGTIGYGFETVSANATLSSNSIVLVDSSSDNITLYLPLAANVIGRKYTIKKMSTLNELYVIRTSDDLIDLGDRVEFLPNSMGLLSVMSTSDNQWTVLSDSSVDILWTPAQLDTSLWLDASDTSTILAGISDNVYQWSDKSGNDRHVTQGTILDQPVTDSVEINGLNAIDFDGSNSEMNIPPLSLTDGTCMIYVFEPDSDTIYSVVGGSVGTVNGHFDRFSDGKTYYEYFRSARPATTVGLQSTGVQMLAYNADPASAYNIRFSGNATFAGGSFTATSDYATNLDLLGRAKNAGTLLNGKIAEVIVVNSFLSDEDIQRIEGYLAHKWGLEGDLAAEHPYKSVAP